MLKKKSPLAYIKIPLLQSVGVGLILSTACLAGNALAENDFCAEDDVKCQETLKSALSAELQQPDAVKPKPGNSQLMPVEIQKTDLIDDIGYIMSSEEYGVAWIRRYVGKKIHPENGDLLTTSTLEMVVTKKEADALEAAKPGFIQNPRPENPEGLEQLGLVGAKLGLSKLLLEKACLSMPKAIEKGATWVTEGEENPSVCSLSYKVTMFPHLENNGKKRSWFLVGEICRYPEGKILKETDGMCFLQRSIKTRGYKTLMLSKEHESRLLDHTMKYLLKLSDEDLELAQASLPTKVSESTARDQANGHESQEQRAASMVGTVSDVFAEFLTDLAGSIEDQRSHSSGGAEHSYASAVSQRRFREHVVHTSFSVKAMMEEKARKQRQEELGEDVGKGISFKPIQEIKASYIAGWPRQTEEDGIENFEFDKKPSFRVTYATGAGVITLESDNERIKLTQQSVAQAVIELTGGDSHNQKMAEAKEKIKDQKTDIASVLALLNEVEIDEVAVEEEGVSPVVARTKAVLEHFRTLGDKYAAHNEHEMRALIETSNYLLQSLSKFVRFEQSNGEEPDRDEYAGYLLDQTIEYRKPTEDNPRQWDHQTIKRGEKVSIRQDKRLIK